MLGSYLLARVKRLRELVFAENAEAAVILHTANVKYFTGVEAPALVALRGGGVLVLVPPLLRGQVVAGLEEEGMAGGVEVVTYTAHPGLFHVEGRVVEAKDVVEALNKLLPPEGLILYDRLGLEAAERLGYPSRRRFKRVDVGKWRAVKEGWEVEAIREAVRCAESGFRALAEELLGGGVLSEAEAAGILEQAMRGAGAEAYAFPTIVAFGPNTVYPHAEPSPTRYLHPHTPVVVDAGAVYHGYCSDMTRSFMYPSPTPDYKAIIEALVDAINAALDTIEPGVKTGEVDAAARRELEKHGLAKYFIHSLGHGVGLEVHEYPRIAPGGSESLEPGMVVTIEPGVYMESSGVGARIEEMVLVTPRGPRVLTGIPLDLFF